MSLPSPYFLFPFILFCYKDAFNPIFFFLFQIASDTVYLTCVNGLGLYFRLMNEVAIRRTFLDRRACLESNSKVEYEKQQEVGAGQLQFIYNNLFSFQNLEQLRFAVNSNSVLKMF